MALQSLCTCGGVLIAGLSLGASQARGYGSTVGDHNAWETKKRVGRRDGGSGGVEDRLHQGDHVRDVDGSIVVDIFRGVAIEAQRQSRVQESGQVDYVGEVKPVRQGETGRGAASSGRLSSSMSGCTSG